MRRKKKRAGLLALLLILNMTALSACGDTQGPVLVPHDFMADADGAETAGKTLIVDILVDPEGYDAEGSKTALLESSHPVEEFRLVEQETGEAVYTGAPEEAEYDEERKQYISIADFTEVEREGTYYLECDAEEDTRSLSFAIREGQYEALLQELCGEVTEAGEKGTLTEQQIWKLLVAAEWYGGVLPDADGDTIPDLLEMVADWQAEREADPESQETMWYVTILAKLGYLYQEYDANYAAKCLQRAVGLYAKLYPASRSVSDSDLYAWVDGQDPERFLALTELYRGTGYRTYRIQIFQYKDYVLKHTEEVAPDDPAYLYGAMTYLATRRSVDLELCETFMESIRDHGEEIGKSLRRKVDRVSVEDSTTVELLRQAETLSCANYILYSYQYTEMLEDILHDLMGRNHESVSYYTEEGDRCDYLLLIAQLVSLRDKR